MNQKTYIKLTVSALLGVAIIVSLACKQYESAKGSAQVESESTTEAVQVNPYEQALNDLNVLERMDHIGVAGISIAIIKNGKLDWAKGYGVLQKGGAQAVDAETMFSVGSISKVGTAVISLRLVNEGKLALDTDVNSYLTSWKVEKNRFNLQSPVTLRRIMSHTAGLTVHGFADYLPEETLPTTVQILNGEDPAKNARVYVDIPVGSQFRYSGGGTTVEQLVIEDVTQLPYHEAAQSLLFSPLEMTRSSYENPLPASYGNIAKAHNRNGRRVALPRGYQSMPEAGASGLWTTPTDLSKMLIALMQAYHGEDESFLPSTLVQDQMTPVSPSNYGLGPEIENSNEHISFSHGGANDSYRAHFTGYLHNKSGIVIFTNGSRGSSLINEIRPILTKIILQT